MPDRKRQDSNRVLVRLIADAVEKWPDMRFHQILHLLDVEVGFDKNIPGLVGPGINATKDLFYEESVDTLDRVREGSRKKLW